MKKIELPKGFKSWSEFYASLESSGLIEDHKIIIRIPSILPPREIYDQIGVQEYFVSDIKEMLLHELWEEKKDFKGLDIDDLIFIYRAIDQVAMNYGNGSEVLKKVGKAIDNIKEVTEKHI